MDAPTRWRANALINWLPILTFTRRRMALLDWFEENLKPEAFTDNPNHAGIAVGSMHQRLRFDRQHLRVATESPDASVRALEGALQATWEVMQPSSCVFSRYHSAWSLPLADDYDTARRRLTRRVANTHFEAGVTLLDTAALVDLRTKTGTYSIEFGVVSADELVERLAQPDVGMLSTGEDDRPGVSVEDPDSLPAVSAFFDISGDFRVRQSSSQSVLSQYEAVEREVSGLVRVIGGSV